MKVLNGVACRGEKRFIHKLSLFTCSDGIPIHTRKNGDQHDSPGLQWKIDDSVEHWFDPV